MNKIKTSNKKEHVVRYVAKSDITNKFNSNSDKEIVKSILDQKKLSNVARTNFVRNFKNQRSMYLTPSKINDVFSKHGIFTPIRTTSNYNFTMDGSPMYSSTSPSHYPGMYNARSPGAYNPMSPGAYNPMSPRAYNN
jgi:hypothetical protein